MPPTVFPTPEAPGSDAPGTSAGCRWPARAEHVVPTAAASRPVHGVGELTRAMYGTIRVERMSLPVASRLMSDVTVELYGGFAAADPALPSLDGTLNGIPALPRSAHVGVVGSAHRFAQGRASGCSVGSSGSARSDSVGWLLGEAVVR